MAEIHLGQKQYSTEDYISLIFYFDETEAEAVWIFGHRGVAGMAYSWNLRITWRGVKLF